MLKGRKRGGLIFSAEELEGKCYEILWNIAMVSEDTYFFNMLYNFGVRTVAGFCKSCLQTTLAGRFAPFSSVPGFVFNHRF